MNEILARKNKSGYDDVISKYFLKSQPTDAVV